MARAPAFRSTNPSSEKGKTIIQEERTEAERLKLFENAKQLADHVASFAPGVYGKELLPRFVTMAPVASTQHQAIPSEDAADGWSAEMEFRLRDFFVSQPQVLSSARVGIACHALQCNLQIAVLQSSVQDSAQEPMKMIDQLKKEDWYGQNFVHMSKSTTMWSPQMMYELWTLRRAH